LILVKKERVLTDKKTKELKMKNKIINLIPEATVLSVVFVILTLTGVISW